MMGAENRRCPRCGRTSLRPVQTTDGTNLVCTTCHRCWYQEQSYLIEMNRYTCPGCDDRTRCRPI